MQARVFAALTDRYVEFDVIVSSLATGDELEMCEALSQRRPKAEFRVKVMQALSSLRRRGLAECKRDRERRNFFEVRLYHRRVAGKCRKDEPMGLLSENGGKMLNTHFLEDGPNGYCRCGDSDIPCAMCREAQR
jgi:hypothetical protein